MRQISTSKGCRSLRSVDWGLRPKASEISLPAPTNFPFGEVQDSSTISFVLTLRIDRLATRCFGGTRSDENRNPNIEIRNQSQSQFAKIQHGCRTRGRWLAAQ